MTTEQLSPLLSESLASAVRKPAAPRSCPAFAPILPKWTEGSAQWLPAAGFLPEGFLPVATFLEQEEARLSWVWGWKAAARLSL